MRNKSNLRVFVISVALVVVVSCAMALYSFTNRSKIDRGNGITSLLEAPFFISSAEAAEASQAADAFPADVAGISAYVKVDQEIDIKKVTPIFREIEDLGDNYTIGVIPIPNFGGDLDVHLYADTDGWLVAYFERGEPAAKIMQWGDADPENPEIGAVKSTTLEDALYKLGSAAGVRIAPGDIRYYHFKFPDANGMTVFVKTRTASGTSVVQIGIPATYTLYEASYYHYVYNKHSELKVDGTLVKQVRGRGWDSHGWERAFGLYEGVIKTGTAHKMEIEYSSSSSAGVATVLIYKTG